MVAAFAPSRTARATIPCEGDSGRPRLCLVEGGSGTSGPTAATYLRRRLIVLALMVTCVVAVAVGAQAALRPLVASPGGGASAAAGVTHPTEGYLVRSGDTLWTVAAAFTPDGSDVRATVDELVGLNGGPVLTVGQRLVLPDR